MPQPEPPTPPSPAAGARARPGAEALAAALATLSDMDAPALRAQWRWLYRCHPPKKLSRALLELGVAWKVQEQALGGLSATNKRQLDELARTMATKSDLAKARKLTLKPGARLIREWGGETHEVAVVEDGFVWQGRTWRSLSVIARAITGTRWSGPRFFGLAGPASTAPRSSSAKVGTGFASGA
jgi:hypothetical protein